MSLLLLAIALYSLAGVGIAPPSLPCCGGQSVISVTALRSTQQLASITSFLLRVNSAAFFGSAALKRRRLTKVLLVLHDSERGIYERH